MDYTGSQGTVVLRAAGDPVTIVRTIIQFIILHYTSSMAEEEVHMELWRASNLAGASIPTMDNAADVGYADDTDLLWKGSSASFVETLTSVATLHATVHALNIDMKGNRTITRNENIILRFGGNVNIKVKGILTMFMKEA